MSAFSRLLRAVMPWPGALRGSVSTRLSPAVRSTHRDALATVEIDPLGGGGLRIGYAPEPDGDTDAGEVVWTWVPYVEHDGRGKDRPVLVIGTHSADRVYAVKLTSRGREGDRDLLAIGTGPWDPQGRPSWVDIGSLYSVHRNGLRREGAALGRAAFSRVAEELSRRHGWIMDHSSG